MTPTEFHRLYDKKLRAYVRRTHASFGLPPYMREDMYQACWLSIGRTLKSWRPDGGRSAFNWCASQMKKEMTAVWRAYFCNPKYGWRREINPFIEHLGHREAIDAPVDIDLVIDLKRILVREPRTAQTRRFIWSALNPNSGADLARQHNLTRQAANAALRTTRRHLRASLIEFEDTVFDHTQRSVSDHGEG